MSYSGPHLIWDSRKCSECSQIRYTYLRAFAFFVKRGRFWKLPSKLAKRVDGRWYGWSNITQEFDTRFTQHQGNPWFYVPAKGLVEG